VEYEDCRIIELMNHAARGDAHASVLLVEELRSFVRGLVEQYGACREPTPALAEQVLSQARRSYGKFRNSSSEFGAWMDGILQREVQAACAREE
jgi:hypothetical protein